MSEGLVDGHRHQIWWNAAGETVVESYSIGDMGHGTPLGKAENDERYGKEGAFLIEAGISSSYHIASFFGLTDWLGLPKEAVRKAVKEAARPIPGSSGAPARTADIATRLRPLTVLSRHAEPPRQPRGRNIDVGAVITRALTAAGLMK